MCQMAGLPSTLEETKMTSTTQPVDEISARRRARLDAETRARLDLGWWWVTEPNPPCVTWCECRHDPEEFADLGIFVCVAAIGGWVRIMATRSAKEGEPENLEIGLTVAIAGAEDVPVEQIDDVVAELQEASAIVAGGAR
jgi:hypothetical protein